MYLVILKVCKLGVTFAGCKMRNGAYFGILIQRADLLADIAAPGGALFFNNGYLLFGELTLSLGHIGEAFFYIHPTLAKGSGGAMLLAKTAVQASRIGFFLGRDGHK